tara:strand:+ start:1854 stop:2444 length:591 start_codon:yes stop_codon:yes gene_type:complete
LSKRSKKSKLLKKAIEMYNEDYTLVNIAKELDINVSTLRRWLRAEGVKPKTNPHSLNPKPEDSDPLQTALDENLDKKTHEAIKIAKQEAREAEEKAILEISEAKNSPAEKYQSYVAASAIKLLRDNLKHLRGPRTIRELSELDQLIRRNLNIDNRGGTGQGLQIDINILNNTKADIGKGAVEVKPNKVIDVEPEDK